jgi:hypothetical protein
MPALGQARLLDEQLWCPTANKKRRSQQPKDDGSRHGIVEDLRPDEKIGARFFWDKKRRWAPSYGAEPIRQDLLKTKSIHQDEHSSVSYQEERKLVDAGQ